MEGTILPSLARNLRHWRRSRGLTVSALALEAGVAKSTVSLIERGRGNPSIDTIWSLAAVLNVPFASLFHDDPIGGDVFVMREADAPVVAADAAGLEGVGLVIRHLLTRTGGELFELYTLYLGEDAVRTSSAHADGVWEHLVVAEGEVEISTDGFCETLRRGDLISFPADRSHTYRALRGPVRLVSVNEYPAPSAAVGGRGFVRGRGESVLEAGA